MTKNANQALSPAHASRARGRPVLRGAAAWAVDPFTVRDIRVEGLQRVEPGTIFASCRFASVTPTTTTRVAAAIRALFGLGLFKDVRLEVSGDVLVVIVEERPTVADVDFVGTKEFDKEVLKKALRDIGLTDGRPFDKALADRAEQELKRQYINRSLYAAEVVTTVTPIERNRVNLTFTRDRGRCRQDQEIRIVGNKAFTESTLRGLFDLDTGGWLSWYTKSDRYSRAKLNADIETLRSYYLTRGYLEFRIDSTQVAISPEQAGHLHHHQRHRRRALCRVGRASWKATTWARRTSSSRWSPSSPARPTTPTRWRETDQGLHRLFRQFRFCLCHGRSHVRRSTAPTTGWRLCCRPIRRAGPMCAASTWRQQPHAR